MTDETPPVTTTENTPSAEDAQTAEEMSSDDSSKDKARKSSKFGRIFRSRSKSSDSMTTPAAAASAEATTPSTDTADDADSPVRKTKSFKRILGSLRGESRQERRERRASEKAAKKAALEEKKAKKAEEVAAKKAAKAGGKAAAAETADNVESVDPALSTAPSGDEDDGSTVFNVDVDERSQATPSVASTTGTKAVEGDEASFQGPDVKKPYMLKVVLLLMDPETRRFELLQLEFDSLKALVADVLKQIPVSVTEDALRKQEYMGICGKDGELMEADKLLSEFCIGNDVLVAIPKEMPPKECARLARPILSDEKVVSMLLASGIDAKGWTEKKAKRKTRDIDAVSSKKAASSSAGTWMIATIILAILVQVGHIYLSAAIKPGHAVQPGVWLRKCGILSFLPANLFCQDDARMVFSKDGHVTVYGANNEVMWEMDGATCSASDAQKEPPCKPELRFHDDLTLTVAGKHILSVKTYKDAELDPWPFAEKPKVRIYKK